MNTTGRHNNIKDKYNKRTTELASTEAEHFNRNANANTTDESKTVTAQKKCRMY